jgi:hypothetical protein
MSNFSTIKLSFWRESSKLKEMPGEVREKDVIETPIGINTLEFIP